MKRYILSAFVAVFCYISLNATESYEYQPLVQEGKTWWYTQYEHKLEWIGTKDYSENILVYEYGLTISGDTTINDILYKKVLIGKNNLGVPENEICVAAVREHKRRGYSEICNLANNSKIDCITEHIRRAINSEDEINIYDFSTAVGDTTQLLKDMLYTQDPLTCDKIDTLYNAKKPLLQLSFSNVIKEVESVGVSEGTIYTVGFFFSPITYIFAGIFQCYQPKLRYVTNSSGEIIYEGQGGLKLWEDDLCQEPVITKSKQWKILVQEALGPGYEEVAKYYIIDKLDSDTIINGKHYLQRFTKKHYFLKENEPEQWTKTTQFFRQAGDLVLCYNSWKERGKSVFNFWYKPGHIFSDEYSDTVYVAAKDTISVCGLNRVRILTDYYNNKVQFEDVTTLGISDIWISGIGSLSQGLNRATLTAGAGYNLVECIEDGKRIYYDERYDYGAVANTIATHQQMECRGGELCVPIAESVRELVIYNAMGAVAAKYTVPTGVNTISLSLLPKGIYIAQLQGAPSYKFVK